MTFNSLEFADDRAFERFALDQLGAHRVRVAEPKYIYGRWGITGKLGMAKEGPREAPAHAADAARRPSGAVGPSSGPLHCPWEC